MSRLIKASLAAQDNTQMRPIQLKSVVSIAEPEEDKEESTNQETDLVEQEILRKQRLAEEAEKKAALMKERAEKEERKALERIAKEEESAKQRIEEAYIEAKETGYKEGFSQGQKDGEASYDLSMEEARELIYQAKEEYHLYLEKAEPVILNLALAVANRIIYTSLEDREGTWLEIVKNAVQEVKEHEEVVIYVPVNRYEETKKQRQEIESLLRYTQDLVFVPDSQLKDGDCFIETPYGRVDASLDSQLSELKSKLQELLNEEKQ